jgi:2-polyprenyl-3-methyl-5-hydroxy-6-metoxy-1,4-benzoquinol methylase
MARRRFRPAIRWLVQDEVFPRSAPGRLLEIGCASGAFLARMRARGWQVEGIEPSAYAAGAAREQSLPVHHGSVESATVSGAPFDMVVLFMTLEHLHEPIETLRRLREWSHPGTWLVLSVPNAASIDFAWFRQRGFAVQAPTHLYHFTPETLELVLNRAGWRTQRLVHQRSEANLMASLGFLAVDLGIPRSTAQWLLVYPDEARLARFLLYPLAFALGASAHSGRLTAWAIGTP